MKLSRLLVIGALAVAAAPAFAMAATLNVGATVQATTPPVQVDTSGTAASAQSGIDVTTGTNVNTNTSTSTGTVDTGTNGMLTITQQDAANGSDTVTSSSQVTSDADFSAYAQSEMRQNPDIKEVDADNSSVMVKYAEPAYVFGVFPVTMTASAKIAADGSVTISYPWYHFLTTSSTNEAAINAGLSTEAAMTLNQQPSQASEGATSTASASATLSASQKAQLLDGIRLVLSSALTASSTASAQ